MSTRGCHENLAVHLVDLYFSCFILCYFIGGGGDCAHERRVRFFPYGWGGVGITIVMPHCVWEGVEGDGQV